MYSIGEISKIVKISVDTLRYYDEIGLLKPIYIDQATRYRYYSEEQVNDMLFIMELKRYGFSLDAIKILLQCKEPDRLKAAFNTRIQQLSMEILSIEKSMNLLKKRVTELESGDENMSESITNNKTILIVDDSDFMRTIMSEFLTKHGYKVIAEAVNGHEGVEKYFELKPNTVIMDIHMPELDGINAARMIMNRDSEARIIMCSAKGYIPMILDSIHAGACDFIVKPFQPNVIIEAIAKNLDERCYYNLNTVKALSENESFNIKNDPLSQDSINKLLSICKDEHNALSSEVSELLNSLTS